MLQNRHPGLHAQRPDHGAAVLDHRPGAPCRPNNPNDMQDDILTAHSRCKPPINLNPHILTPPRHQTLRRQHMLDLTGAYPEGQRPKRAMRTRMAVPTHHRRPG